MKRITFALVALMLITLVSYGQKISVSEKKHIPFVVETRTTPFGKYVNKNTPIFSLADSGVVYIPKQDFSAASTLNTILASPAYYYSFEPAVPFSSIACTGNVTIDGNVGIGTTDNNKFVIIGASGNAITKGTFCAVGSVGIGTTDFNKFTVAGATGNTAIAGTLVVTGASTLTGATGVTGNFAVNTNKFAVTASSGNTAVAGTLTSTGKIYANGDLIKNCAVPKPFDSTGTLAAADMLRGVITCTSGSATTMTTPTATAIAALITGCARGTTFDLVIDNSAGSSTITLALDASIGVVTPAITGGAALTVSTANAVGCFRFYFTSGTTAKVFRIY